MTVIDLTPATALPTEPCGDDCVYFDGRCWCYYGEPTSPEFSDAALDSIKLPF